MPLWHTLKRMQHNVSLLYVMIQTKTMHIEALHAAFCFDRKLENSKAFSLPYMYCIYMVHQVHSPTSCIYIFTQFTIHIIIKNSIGWLDERMVIVDIVNHKLVWSFAVVVDFLENFLYLMRFTNRLKRYLEHRFYLYFTPMLIHWHSVNSLNTNGIHHSNYKFELCFVFNPLVIAHAIYSWSYIIRLNKNDDKQNKY